MPSYAQMAAQYVSLRNQTQSLVDSINREVPLGSGYSMRIWVETRDDPGVRFSLLGSPLDVNALPDMVLHRYYTNAKAIKDWIGGSGQDFPVLLSAKN